MSIADAPDWYNAGGANPFSAQAVLLDNANPSAGLPISVQIPTDSSPFHTLGIYAPYAGQAELPKLAVVGDQSGIIFYDNYLESDIQRFGGPVVVPITTLYDTSISFIPSLNNIVGVFAWLYLDSVPPVSRPYASQIHSVTATVNTGGFFTILPADVSISSWVLHSVNFAQNVANPATVALRDPFANILSSFASAGLGCFHDDLGDAVILSNGNLTLSGLGTATNSVIVNLRYWKSFTTDGLDIL